ncbi:MAG TPA: site-2 protease family protein [Planctomycetaceae bacterium]|jgi:Zn-dependent protease|nr:site-2 protease family protein [Planctomycetaceae bacterium]
MFGPVATTQFDLRFRLFGIPVHVTPWFWAAGVFLAWDLVSERRIDLLALWLFALFVSILVHEYGHAFCAELFGCYPEIYLYHFGGLAVFQPNSRFSTWRSIIVSFAGPFAGFLLFGVILVVAMFVASSDWLRHLDPQWQDRVGFFILQMEYINLSWGLVNLLPVLPLDGGRISESLLIRFRRRDGQRLAILISAIVAGAVAAVFATRLHDNYAAMFFAIMCITNIQALQQFRRY